MVSLILALLIAGYFFARKGPNPAPEYSKAVPSAPNRSVSSSSFKKVRAQVRAKNAVQAAQREAFLKEGWQFVQTDPPDARVMDLDINSLSSLEAEFQAHLQSNTFSGEMLDRVRDIALRTEKQKTRFLAIESLGRSNDVRAQENLISVYEKVDESSVQSQILGLLKPSSLDDSISTFLIHQINESASTDEVKAQAAMPLIVLGLSKSMSEPPQGLIRRIDPHWQMKFRELYQTVKSGGKSYARSSN